ncbi:MAG: folylpolyglutamate synthase/dihydrofolate synthase family protein [Parachlamydiaceae bacterium]
MVNHYQQLLDKLLSVNINGGIKLGLENSLLLSNALDNPHKKFPTVHIAGTNGKGSVTTKIAAALQATGKKVGLYTSPHISTFRERIRINGNMISEEQVVEHLDTIFSIIEKQQIPATFFELTTLLCFSHFAHENVDIAVIETGLGGRFDATNIITPKLSVITSISLEHTEFLGNTIEAIAKEKAGIIKPTVPVVIGPHVPYSIVNGVAAAQGSPCIQVLGDFPDYHAENNAVAGKALEILNVDKEAITEGLQATPPCRLEVIDKVILDAAHNPDGFYHMLQATKLRFPHQKLRLVVGLSSNKDIEGCFNIVKGEAIHFYLVEANSSRAVPTETMKEILIKLEVEPALITSGKSIAETMNLAIDEANKAGDIVVVCGTFFILHEVRQALGFNPPEDCHNLNEQHKPNAIKNFN